MTNEALRSKTTRQPTELAKSANSLRATKNSGNESKEALENDSVWRLSTCFRAGKEFSVSHSSAG